MRTSLRATYAAVALAVVGFTAGCSTTNAPDPLGASEVPAADASPESSVSPTAAPTTAPTVEASPSATPESAADVTVEFRSVHLATSSADPRDLLPEPSDDWATAVEGWGLTPSDDAVAAAEWVVAGDCDAPAVSTDQVAGVCSIDGSESYLLGAVEMDESVVADAESFDSDGNTGVLITLNAAGGTTLEALTGELATLQEPRNRLAIVVDGEVLSSPTVAAAISGGQFQIIGLPDDPALLALTNAFNN